MRTVAFLYIPLSQLIVVFAYRVPNSESNRIVSFCVTLSYLMVSTILWQRCAPQPTTIALFEPCCKVSLRSTHAIHSLLHIPPTAPHCHWFIVCLPCHFIQNRRRCIGECSITSHFHFVVRWLLQSIVVFANHPIDWVEGSSYLFVFTT